MDVFRSRFGSRAVFVLATDDLRWAHAMFDGTPDVHLAAAAPARVSAVEAVPFDMALLANCNHSIIRYRSKVFLIAFSLRHLYSAFSNHQ